MELIFLKHKKYKDIDIYFPVKNIFNHELKT